MKMLMSDLELLPLFSAVTAADRREAPMDWSWSEINAHLADHQCAVRQLIHGSESVRMGLRRGIPFECPLLLPFRATPQRQPCIGNSGDAPALLVHRRSFRVGLKDYVAEWQPY